MIIEKDPSFTRALAEATREAEQFSQVIALHNARKRAEKSDLTFAGGRKARIAVVGSVTLRPLADLVDHFIAVNCEAQIDLWTGEYDAYVSEIMDPGSELYRFKPDVILIVPSERKCRYTGSLLDPISEQRQCADKLVGELLGLCENAHLQSGAEVILCNFPLPPYYDPGPLRSSSLACDYGFRKYVNMQLGLACPTFVHICDAEFIGNRLGTLRVVDDRAWFESKQPFSAEMAVQVAREVAEIVSSLKRPSRKVIVFDLDDTIWGGVIGDDGLDGIEVGTTSPRGEAFRDFQEYLLSLSKRGILLAVCSKNDHERAVEPFESHPEMVLRMSNIVNFKANWEPKSDNVRQIAAELNLGLDSFVFVDDNPAEIEIVRQFLPQVACICVGADPSTFVAQLKDSRLFETRSVTTEDLGRVSHYKQEADRQSQLDMSTDMESYLASLEMVGRIAEFQSVDVPRITQLINKSNQFNLTTRRRTESEVLEIIDSPVQIGFTIRLSDRFGDHGLIAVVVCNFQGAELVIDTWLMSCRVLKRGVEQETLNEIVRRAKVLQCDRVLGTYIPSKKNGMVKDLYCNLGFVPIEGTPGSYALASPEYVSIGSQIAIQRDNP